MIAFDSVALPPAQKSFAIVFAISMLVIVLELVRKRKLREEYTVLWTVTALLLLALALDPGLLSVLVELFGADQGTSVLFLGALIFLMLVALQFSIRLTKLTFRNKTLSQRVALLEQELAELKQTDDDASSRKANRSA